MHFIPPFPKQLPDISGKGLVAAADEYAIRVRAFYNSRAVWHRRFHRLSGVLIILAGAGLPVLANLEYPAKATVISIAGMAVAVLTGLHAFYHWDQSWILLRTTEGEVTAAYWAWRAALPPNGDDTDEQTVARTTAFLAQLGQIRTNEASNFFANVTFPAASGGQSASR
nr:DUF4231 domain-containing protein [Kibdelosporangium sp. MJ126-NF4]CEL14571.1 hypothetical protein [Kibdelosporangium sp. MJ126-NF4]CTQ88936.1 hypothetical protein [Kibdelosporangium sp. MJ126-NF4]